MDRIEEQYTSQSVEETHLLGKKIAQRLSPNSVLCFFGDLGAGKTTLIKAIAAGLTGCSVDDVVSPTYAYLNVYDANPGGLDVYHFDLYRLSSASEFVEMGFDEMFDRGGVCCLEWSERIEPILPVDRISIFVLAESDGSRIIRMLRE